MVNEIALALHEAGQPDGADQMYATLNGAPIDKARWRVNMKINRLEVLVADGRFDRALQILPLTEESAAKAQCPESIS